MKSAAAIVKTATGNILKNVLILSKKINTIDDEDFFVQNHFCKRCKIIRKNPSLLICFNFGKCFLHRQGKITLTYYNVSSRKIFRKVIKMVKQNFNDNQKRLGAISSL